MFQASRSCWGWPARRPWSPGEPGPLLAPALPPMNAGAGTGAAIRAQNKPVNLVY